MNPWPLSIPLSLCAAAFIAATPFTDTRAATRTWTGGGGDDFWSTPGNWGGTAPTIGDVLSFQGTVRLNNTNNLVSGTGFGGIRFDSPAGAFVLRGNSINLSGGIIENNQVVTLQTIALPLFVGATRIDVVTNGSLTISGVMSGAGNAITKTGGGLLTLTEANTFGGAVMIEGGTLSVSSDANLGATPTSPRPGAIIVNGGTLRATASFTLNANRGIALGGIAAGGEGIFEVPNDITLSYGGTALGTGGLTKLRFGGLTLSGANTYSGRTAIKNGTLTLDFTPATSPVSNIISPLSALTLGGATAGAGTTNYAALIMNGKAGASNSQTFNGTTIDIGQAQIRANSGAGGSATINLGALSRNPGGVVHFIPPSLTGGTGNITTTATNVNGIIAGWAMVSDGTPALQNGTTGNPIPPAVATNFAAVDASGNIIPYTNYTIYAAGNLADILWGTNNVRITGETMGDIRVAEDNAGIVHDVNTLTFSRGFDWGLNIGVGNTLRLGKTGALFSQHHLAAGANSSPTWGITSLPGATPNAQGHQDVGTLTAGGPTDNTPGEIIIHLSQAGSGSADNFVIDCKVTDNGIGPVSIIKAGPGFFKLRGHNTYSGGTYVLQGRIQLSGSEVGTSNPDGIGTGPLYIFPGGYLFFAGTGSPITNDMFIAGDAARQEQGIGAIRTSGGWSVQGTVTLIGDATIGGNGNVSGGIAGRITDNGAGYNLTLCSGGTVNGTISISNPSNDWTGNTIIQARNNQGNNTFVSGGSEIIPNGFGKGNVQLLGYTTGAITWNLNGFNETINGLSTPGNGATCTIQNNGATPSTLIVGDNDQSGTFAGVLGGGSGTLGLTKIGGGRQVLSAVNTYTGPTIINGGTLALSAGGSIATSTQISIDGGTLDVSEVTGGFTHAFPVGVTNGVLALRNTVAPGISALHLQNSRLRVTGVGSTPIVIDAAVLTTGGPTNLIDIVSIGAVNAYPARFTIIKYGGFIDGAGFNFALGSVPTPSTVGYLTNDAANTSVDLVLLDGPKPLLWRGTPGNNWDIATTANWLAFAGTPTATPATFLNVDLVRFDDSGGANAVNLTTALQPGAVVVSNNSVNYTFSGPGQIGGPTGITKEGTGTLILDNSGTNNFFGALAINAGTVQVGNNSANGSLGLDGVINNANLTLARSDDATIPNVISGAGTVTQNGPGTLTLSGANTFTGPFVVAQSTAKPGSSSAFGTTEGRTTVNPGATLDVNGQGIGAEPVFVQGTGVGGRGAIINTGADQINALHAVALSGDTTFGGSARWDIRNIGGTAASLSGEPFGSPFKITKIGSNQVSLVGVNVDPGLADIDIREGTFSVQTTTSQVGNPASALTVRSGATLGLFGLNQTPLQKAIGLADGARIWGESGSNVIAGAISLEGRGIFDVANAPAILVISGEIGGTGGLTKIGAGPMAMRGAFNGYSGATIISNGTLYVDATYAEFGTFTVHGGTLGGIGTINGPVVIGPNGTLSPGSPGTLISPLTIANSVTLGGTTVIDVDKTGGVISNDQLAGVNALTLGGALRLNLTGEPLALGDSIDLSAFQSASGSFASIVPATPGANLSWDVSRLTVDGTLRVAGQSTQPSFSGVRVSGTNAVFSGSGGPPNVPYHVLSTTNLSPSLSNWIPIATNLFDANGNFNVTNAIDAPQRFFLIRVP